MQRHCDECGTVYEAKRPTSKFCSTRCRTRQTRKRGTGIETTPPAITVLDGSGSTALTDATRAEIERANLAGTANAILLLTLAARIDAVPETSPALASLSKEYAARKAEMFSQARAVVDPFDELRALRERRRA